MQIHLEKMLIGTLALTATLAGAQTPNDIFRNTRTLVTADAINDQSLVPIGGIPQWVSVRGRHASQPLLLFLHGGPAFTVSPVGYYYRWPRNGRVSPEKFFFSAPRPFSRLRRPRY